MFPTFHDGEYVLTNLIGQRFSDPKLGDVVVFESPINKEKDYIKRVIGVPGDTVEIKNGIIFVNGNQLDENAYLSPDVKTYAGAFLHENQPVTVPSGKYFVVGDNRPNSSDSREWGFITKAELLGTSMFVYWPPNRARIVKNPFEK